MMIGVYLGLLYFDKYSNLSSYNILTNDNCSLKIVLVIYIQMYGKLLVPIIIIDTWWQVLLWVKKLYAKLQWIRVMNLAFSFYHSETLQAKLIKPTITYVNK